MAAASIEESLYVKSEIHRCILLRIEEVGENLKSTLENKIRTFYEGKCCAEGIIKQGSSKIVTYSCGKIDSAGLININLVIECQICNPVAGMVIPCVVRSITKAGLGAESNVETPSPIKVFISREYTSAGMTDFSGVKMGDAIMIRVIGQRYQLNDPVIYIIGEIQRPERGRRYVGGGGPTIPENTQKEAL